MKRFAMALALVCVLSRLASAGEMPGVDRASAETQESNVAGDMPAVDSMVSTDDSVVSVILTILNIVI